MSLFFSRHGGLRVSGAHGRWPGGVRPVRFGKVEGELEKCESRGAGPATDRPDMVLPARFPGEAPVERLPVRKGEPADQTSKIVPQMEVPPLVSRHPLEHPAAALPDLVDEKGEHGEHPEHVAQMVAAVAAGVLETVHVPGLERLEGLVFNGPPAMGASRDRPRHSRFISDAGPSATRVPHGGSDRFPPWIATADPCKSVVGPTSHPSRIRPCPEPSQGRCPPAKRASGGFADGPRPVQAPALPVRKPDFHFCRFPAHMPLSRFAGRSLRRREDNVTLSKEMESLVLSHTLENVAQKWVPAQLRGTCLAMRKSGTRIEIKFDQRIVTGQNSQPHPLIDA